MNECKEEPRHGSPSSSNNGRENCGSQHKTADETFRCSGREALHSQFSTSSNKNL